MHTYYNLTANALTVQEDITPNTLINLVNPTEAELAVVAEACKEIDRNDFSAALDDEEPSRIEINDRYTLLVLDVPIPEKRGDIDGYQTYPLTIIVAEDNIIITISLVDFHLASLGGAMAHKMIGDGKKYRYASGIIMAMASVYQTYLREIEAHRVQLVERLSSKTTKDDLLKLHGLETDIVYFETSLNANRVVLDRAAKSARLVSDDFDRDLFDDILIEINQASEMAHIYQQLVASTRNLFTSVMDNSLNSTMKILTSLTIILSIPMVVAGFYGMNVAA
ncbi:MAG: magnesium transporter CorA family protein, partial [Raoultibacter sp.]